MTLAVSRPSPAIFKDSTLPRSLRMIRMISPMIKMDLILGSRNQSLSRKTKTTSLVPQSESCSLLPGIKDRQSTNPHRHHSISMQVVNRPTQLTNQSEAQLPLTLATRPPFPEPTTRCTEVSQAAARPFTVLSRVASQALHQVSRQELLPSLNSDQPLYQVPCTTTGM